MKINLITIEEHAQLINTYSNSPVLTLQNKGYEYINKANLSKEDWKQIETVEAILKKSICGFASFSNFRLTPQNELQIRLQYNYNYDGRGLPFIGVGYILVDELLNGFKN